MKYLFLILLFTVAANADLEGDYLIRSANNQDLDWWENGVFYQIYPRSFKDSNGDGLGDIRGIIDNLEHLKDLGVTGFWLGPIFESPMIDGGYDITNFYQVDSRFGSNQDLYQLIARAKELDLKILLDYVPNHTSDQHMWFRLSAARMPGFENLYIWRPCEVGLIPGQRRLTNNWIGVYHTPTWSYNEERDQCYLHHYSPQQPDLDYRNPYVREQMLEVFRFWMQQGIDGFRVDAVRVFETGNLSDEGFRSTTGDFDSRDNFRFFHRGNRPETRALVRDYRRMLDAWVANSPNETSKVLMLDTYYSIREQIPWYGSNETEVASQIPMNFALLHQLDGTSDAYAFKTTFDHYMELMPTWGVPNCMMGNHDHSRINHRYGEHRHDSIAILSLMMPGPNIIYYGEEIGMQDNRNIPLAQADDPQRHLVNSTVFAEITRDPARTPFQWDATPFAGFSNVTTWLPVHADFTTNNLAAQKAADRSTYKLYQRLIEMRKENRVLEIGGYTSMVVAERVFGFMRTLPHHHTLAVLVNLGGAISVNLSHAFGDEYPRDFTGHVLVSNVRSAITVGTNLGKYQNFQLGPYDALVIEISSAGKVTLSIVLLVCSLIKFIF